jgi:hypothetical protein
MIFASKSTFSHKKLKILRPKVTKFQMRWNVYEQHSLPKSHLKELFRSMGCPSSPLCTQEAFKSLLQLNGEEEKTM